MVILYQCPSCKHQSNEDVISMVVQPACEKCKTFMEPWLGDRFGRYKEPKNSLN